MKHNEGYSYVEMLMVLAIMAIMVGMVTVSVGLVNRNTAARTSEKLETLANKARTYALTKGKNKGCLNIAEYNGDVYAYVGERIPNSQTDQVKEKGSKICNGQYEVIVSGKSTCPSGGAEKEVLHIGFKQSTGGIDSADGNVVVVKKKGTTKSNSFTIYTQTGKIKR